MPATTKHARVYADLEAKLRSKTWTRGERLPSESELVRQYGASRITIGRALRDLQGAGLIERRAGSGSYATGLPGPRALTFGVLVPDFGEVPILESMYGGMMSSSLAREHALILGSAEGDSKESRALQLCRQYVERQVDGVFFAPLELSPDKDDVNRRLVRTLDEAHVPVVLLDRTVLPYPHRGHHDLVGIDNRRAGFVVTDHLLGLGRRALAFVAPARAAATVGARAAGYREAHHAHGLEVDPARELRLDPSDVEAAKRALARHGIDGAVCANDETAAQWMHTLHALGYAVPDDVAIVGIDDAPFAKLLPVPLTTLRQPARQIGEAALSAMLERVARSHLPARDILLRCELVVRRSCGHPARALASADDGA